MLNKIINPQNKLSLELDSFEGKHLLKQYVKHFNKMDGGGKFKRRRQTRRKDDYLANKGRWGKLKKQNDNSQRKAREVGEANMSNEDSENDLEAAIKQTIKNLNEQIEAGHTYLTDRKEDDANINAIQLYMASKGKASLETREKLAETIEEHLKNGTLDSKGQGYKGTPPGIELVQAFKKSRDPETNKSQTDSSVPGSNRKPDSYLINESETVGMINARAAQDNYRARSYLENADPDYAWSDSQIHHASSSLAQGKDPFAPSYGRKRKPSIRVENIVKNEIKQVFMDEAEELEVRNFIYTKKVYNVSFEHTKGLRVYNGLPVYDYLKAFAMNLIEDNVADHKVHSMVNKALIHEVGKEVKNSDWKRKVYFQKILDDYAGIQGRKDNTTLGGRRENMEIEEVEEKQGWGKWVSEKLGFRKKNV